MQDQHNICHDLKTDRPDIGQPLPAILAFLPILFLLAVVAAIGLNILFFFQLKGAEKAHTEWTAKVEEEGVQQKKIASKIQSIRAEEQRAMDVRDWVEGSREMVPLAVTIAKSMNEYKSNIAELSLYRDVASANQVRIGLKFDSDRSDVARQLDHTLQEVEDAVGYRAYSASQTKGKSSGSLDYQATLIWQPGKNNNEELTSNEQ